MKFLTSRLAIRHLRMVVAISEEGNLVRAAKRLNMTQSAVTKSLQELEALTKLRLFDRTNRGVIATLYGETLAAHARIVMAQLSHAEEHLADLRDGNGGRIVIGTLLSAAAQLLPRAFAELRRQRPRIMCKIVEGTNDVLIPALLSGELDMVVGRLPENHNRANVSQEILMEDIACVVARSGHPLADRGGLMLADLLQWDWILPPPETSLRRQIDIAFWQEGLEPPGHMIESVSILTNRSLLTEADYLGVFPIQVAQREAASGEIVILPVILRATRRPIGITIRKDGRLSPAAESFAEILRRTAKDLSTPIFDATGADLRTLDMLPRHS